MAQHTPQRRFSRVLAGGIASGIIVASGVVLGTSTAAVAEGPASSEDSLALSSCNIVTAELQWGLKTSFRNYISGSIANGEWATENGASYETPAFTWGAGEGTFESDLTAGSVGFTGDIHFTGHEGLMRLDLSDPEIVFTGADSAQLVFGVGSAATLEAEITYERIAIAKVDLAGYEAGNGSTLSIDDASVRLTAEGAAALNNDFGDYVSGEEMDSLALNLTTSGCALDSSAGKQDPVPEKSSDEEAQLTPIAEEAPAVPWVPIAIGGVALAAVAVTGGMLLAGRKKGPGTES